jgi:hypothetical protein
MFIQMPSMDVSIPTKVSMQLNPAIICRTAADSESSDLFFWVAHFSVPRPYDGARWAGAVHALAESMNSDGPGRVLSYGILEIGRSKDPDSRWDEIVVP